MERASSTLPAEPSGTPLGPAEWRHLIGHWTTGVAVVTSSGTDGPRGCTANALTSLSLDPLLLLVCFARDSHTLEAVRRSGRFCVNILAAGQEALARDFAVKCDDDSKFSDAPYELIEALPVLSGTLAWVACEVRRELSGGDHVIVIAEPFSGSAVDGVEPLIFCRRAYS